MALTRRPEAPATDPLISDFLDYLRVERRLAANSVEAYGRDLGRYAGFLSTRGASRYSVGSWPMRPSSSKNR